MKTIYNGEVHLAFGLGFMSLIGGSALIAGLRHARQQKKQVMQEQPTTNASSTGAKASRIEIITATGDAGVDKMNICKLIRTQYFERCEMDIAEIKCRRPSEKEMGQLGEMIFLGQVRSQIQQQYPIQPIIPIVIYLNKTYIIVIC